MQNDQLNLNGAIAIDTETTGLRYRHSDRMYSVSLCDEEFNSFYVEFYVDPKTRMPQYSYYGIDTPCEGFMDNCSPTEVFEYIRSICENPSIPKIFHHKKFDAGMLRAAGINLQGEYDDTKIMARVINTSRMSYGLKPLALEDCGIPTDDIKELKYWVQKLRQEAKRNSDSFTVSPESEAADYWLTQQVRALLDLTNEQYDHIERLGEIYCRKDTVRTMALWKKYKAEIEADGHFMIAYDRELEILPLIERMEERGVGINQAIVLEDRKISENLAAVHLKAIYDSGLVPGDFNANSPKQLQELLYHTLGLKPTKFTDSGQPSTEYKTLKDLEHKHPVMHDIIQYKSHSKAISTFFDNYLALMLPDKLNPGGHCLHPVINQDNARTMRFSYEDPNLQQVSNPDTSFKGSDVVQARNGFGPRPDHVWYHYDYAQMELRVFAGAAKVQSIIDDILAGRDPNTEIANKAWGGKGNPNAIRQAALSMELGSMTPSSPIMAEVWETYGWNSEKAKHGERSTIAEQAAYDWLSDNNWDIVAAETAVGKKMTRNRAKMVMFAMLYGGGAKAVMGLLYCSRQEALDHLNAIDRAYPEIRQYMKRLTREAIEKGYIINLYGRKLRIAKERSYTCVNYMVQGSSADMIKLSMLRCDKVAFERQVRCYECMTIHDEIAFEIHKEDDSLDLLRDLKYQMENHMNYVGVPMEVGVKKVVSQWSLDEKVKL